MGHHITTISLCGHEVECTVEFIVTSYGSDAITSGTPEAWDPGSPREIEIQSVRSNVTGIDYMALLAATPTGKLATGVELDIRTTPHCREVWCVMRSATANRRLDYTTILRRESNALHDIEREILDDPTHFEIDHEDYADDYHDRQSDAANHLV